MKAKPHHCLLLLAAVLAVLAGAPAGASEVRVIRTEGGQGAFLGVSLEEETDHAEGGARVTQVIEGSPAAEAGIEEGDVIQGFDGDRIRGPVSLTERIHGHKPGDRVSLKLVRDGDVRQVDVELGEREVVWGRHHGDVFGVPLDEEKLKELTEGWHEKLGDLEHFKLEGAGPHAFIFGADRPRLGVQLTETTPELRSHFGGSEDAGVLVSKVLDGMPAEKAGFHVGDLIVAVDGEQVASASELAHAIRSQEGTFEVEIVRERKKMTLEVTLPEEEALEKPTGPRAYFVPRQAAPAPQAPLGWTPTLGSHPMRIPVAAPLPPAPPDAPLPPSPMAMPDPPAPPAPPDMPAPPGMPAPRIERWV